MRMRAREGGPRLRAECRPRWSYSLSHVGSMFSRLGDAPATRFDRSCTDAGRAACAATHCGENVTNAWRERLARMLQEPVDTSSLAVFRLLFGLTMAAACTRVLLK